MGQDIKESDWKVFRQLREVALDRFCARVLAEVNALISGTRKTNHERYAELFGILKDRDEELAGMFDGLSRSGAMTQLLLIQSRDLLTQEEMSRLSPEARDSVATGLKIVRK